MPDVILDPRTLSTVDAIRYIEDDLRAIRNRMETGMSIDDQMRSDSSAAERIAAYAWMLTERGY